MEQSKILVLYTIVTGDSNSQNAIVALQAYPGGYDRVSILFHNTGYDEIRHYKLFARSLSAWNIPVSQLETLAVHVEEQGYVFAGGIWQVAWSSDQQRLIIQLVCSSNIALEEVAVLLSDAEILQVREAILVAYTYVNSIFSGNRTLMLVSCEEIEGDTLGQHRQIAHEGDIDWRYQKTWQIVINDFGTREKPHPAITRSIYVHYHPDHLETPYMAELVER